MYVLLINHFSSCSNQATLWSFLCDCGEFALTYRYACGQKNKINVENLLFQACHQAQDNPYLLFVLHSIIDSIQVKSTTIKNMWVYLNRVVSVTNDFESFFSVLQFCDQFPNESIFKMILITLKNRFIRLPLTFHTQCSSSEIRSLIQCCMFNGVERELSSPKSPSLYRTSPSLWTNHCFETKVSPISTTMEVTLRIFVLED